MESIHRINQFPSSPASFPYVVHLVDKQIWLSRCVSVETAVTSAEAEVPEIHISDTNATVLMVRMIGAATPHPVNLRETYMNSSRPRKV